MTVVSNASPLVVLSRVGLLSLLEKLFKRVHITQAVYDELVVPGRDYPGSKELAQAKGEWLLVHPMPPEEELRRYRKAGLSWADVSVLVLAEKQGADLVLADERALRRALQERNIPVAGVGGILLMAKDQRLIPNVRDPLKRAQQEGLRISKSLAEKILRKAGELEDPSS